MARKIEQQMLDAALHVRDWHHSNTEVKACTNQANDLPVSRVYLHGHHIANLQQVRHDKMELQVIEETLRNWPTNTTISRLRALGANVYSKNHVVYLNDQPVADRR